MAKMGYRVHTKGQRTRPPFAKTWFTTGRILKRTRDATRQAMRIVKVEMADALKKVVSKAYPPPSRPGRSPHKRTGNLQESIRVTYNERDQTLNVNMQGYGFYLESGTRRMDRRPFVEPVIHKQRAKWEDRIRNLQRKFYGS